MLYNVSESLVNGSFPVAARIHFQNKKTPFPNIRLHISMFHFFIGI